MDYLKEMLELPDGSLIKKSSIVALTGDHYSVDIEYQFGKKCQLIQIPYTSRKKTKAALRTFRDKFANNA